MKRIALSLVMLLFASFSLSANSIIIKIGVFTPSQNSDLWKQNYDYLTYKKSDFLDTTFGAEFEMQFARHFALSFEGTSYSRTVYSRYDSKYVGDNIIPYNITLRLTGLEVNLKFYPFTQRRMLFPYFGIGGGIYSWFYEQWGDYVVEITDETITVIPEASSLTRKVVAGFNGRFGLTYRFQRKMAVFLEGKYQYIKGALSDEFQGFELFDLSGLTIAIGVVVYFY